MWFDDDQVSTSTLDQGAQDDNIARSRVAGFDASAALTALVTEADLGSGGFGERTVVAGTGAGATVELFEGQRVVAEVTEVAVRRPLDEPGERPWVEWLGAVHDTDGAVLSQVTMTFIPQPDGTYTAAGSVTTNDGHIGIHQIDGGTYQLDQYGLSSDLPLDSAGNSTGEPPATNIEDGTIGPASHGSLPHIDVIVGMGSGFSNPASTRDQIAARMADANQAMISSGVQLRINLMAIRQVTYSQAASMVTDKDRLVAGFGGLSDLHTLRTNMGADLVGLVVPNQTPDHCGLANDIPEHGGTSTAVWQVSAAECFLADRHVLTHEFGHLLGADHNTEDAGDPSYSFSYGYYRNGVARTVMSYDRRPNGTAYCSSGCPIALQFSSPAYDFVGRPGVRSGVAGTDNSLALNNLDSYIQGYRTAASKSPIGYFDWIRREPGGFRVSGWTIDENTFNPIDMHVWIDGSAAGFNPPGFADDTRSDVGNVYPMYGPKHGYSDKIGYQTAGSHQVCTYGINYAGTPGGNTQLGCKTITISNQPFGAVNSVQRTTLGLQVQVKGWAIDPDTSLPVGIEVYIDGSRVSTATANTTRTDVGSSYPGYGINHGYDHTFTYVQPGSHQVCVYALNASGTPGSRRSLGCRNIS